MDLEIGTTLKLVKAKTGIDVDLYAKTGKFFVSTREEKADYPLHTDVEEILQDEAANKTYFSVRYRRTDLIGVIDGTDKTAKNYAALICGVIEGQTGRESGLTKEEELKSILLGDYNKTRVQRFREKYALPDVPCFVLAFPAGTKTAELLDILKNYDENRADSAVVMDDNGCAFVKFLDKDTQSVFQSPTEYAETLASSVEMELGLSVRIGVGCAVKEFHEVGTSYQQAATALRMSTAFGSKGLVHTYREFLLVRMLEDVPKFKLKEYLSILADADSRAVFQDEDLMNTAEEFLENSLNVSETSRNLYMHRNTLMYRLDKIERLTGLNIRSFEDAVSFRLITILYKVLD